ncbi:hypothetical protein V6C03_13770 [Methyloligella sp. 2.7D]|uniref:hypothetical protein n=1 Tax=unclassified Methyloligella TaxID=2625955 RepID=UPI00157BEBAB|nr:hypothetical protein [Methyloligella sp. GL2]QKP77170.1 hypothetical protein HT051_06695 [Methyloligella sp. GL2]
MTASQEKAFDMIAMSGFGGGIWANYIPDGVTGEFDSYDPVGLMAGDLIKADCSLSWRGPEGKTYCFSTAPSLVYFQDFPERNIRKAKKAYESLTSGKPGS